MPGFTVFAQFRGKETSDWDKKYVSELGKISSLTYEKLADHDRIPLIIIIISCYMPAVYHAHLGSNQMLKKDLTKKIKILKKKACHCRNKNVFHTQGCLVTWLSDYSINKSYSVQFSTNI